VDVQKQIDYWRNGAAEDIVAARALLETEHPRHALFFAHLGIEKMLKAHIVKATRGLPPRTHDLLRLADLAGILLSPERREFLGRFQQYCLEGRYPDQQPPLPREEAAPNLREAQEVFSWLISLL
jgi:HEPN domain-containing protein